jgi:predicted kinase
MSATSTDPAAELAQLKKTVAAVVSAAASASDPAMWMMALTAVHSLVDSPTGIRATAPDASSPRLLVTVGLPASGKTTEAVTWVAEDPARRARVNRDDLRRMLHGGRLGTAEQEAAVTAIQHPAVLALLGLGYDVVADDMNLSTAAMGACRRLSEQAGAWLDVWNFTDVDVEDCVRRDAERTGPAHVGEPVIRRLHTQHVARGR